MADETCPLCEGEGKGLPGYYGTMADMFTLLFAFFVLMFSLATMDPAKLSDLGGDDKGSSPEEIEEMVDEVKKQTIELKEQGIDVDTGENADGDRVTISEPNTDAQNLENQRPDWLPQKFKSAEELSKRVNQRSL